MKAKCIKNSGYEDTLTLGKEYIVKTIWDHKHTEITIVDDLGHSWEYPIAYFELLDTA